MKKRHTYKIIFIVLAILIPLTVIVLFTALDLGKLFDSWANKEVKPDGRYILMILFKLSIYIFPPLIGMIGFYKENKYNVKKKKFLFYFIKALNVHFLILLTIKLLAESIFEVDKIWGLTLFNSIKDVQTLIGFILTFIISKNIKIASESLLYISGLNVILKIKKEESAKLLLVIPSIFFATSPFQR